MTIIDQLRAEIEERKKKIVAIQRECSHPISARDTQNAGSSGGWDSDDHYWTRHHCTLCDRHWNTDQNWQHAGDGLGMPKEDSE